MSNGLDSGAMAHVRLMANPCTAPLVFPAYDSPSSGYLVRKKTVVSLGTGSGETAGFIHWVPGKNYIIAKGAADGGTNLNPDSVTTAFASLAGVDTSQAPTSYRCIAACMRIITNSPESSRSGIIHVGNTDASYVNQFPPNGSNVVPATKANFVASGLASSMRTPSGYVEVVWVPGTSDQSWDSQNSGFASFDNTNMATIEGHAAITAAVVGHQATTGLTVELVAVYEINAGQRDSAQVVQPPTSGATFGNVIRALFRQLGGSTVALDTARSILSVAGAAYPGSSGVRLAAGLAKLVL